MGRSAGAVGSEQGRGLPEQARIHRRGALRLQPGEGSDQVFDGKSKPALQPAHVNSLKCDFIQEHGDVANDRCGRIVAAALA